MEKHRLCLITALITSLIASVTSETSEMCDVEEWHKTLLESGVFEKQLSLLQQETRECINELLQSGKVKHQCSELAKFQAVLTPGESEEGQANTEREEAGTQAETETETVSEEIRQEEGKANREEEKEAEEEMEKNDLSENDEGSLMPNNGYSVFPDSFSAMSATCQRICDETEQSCCGMRVCLFVSLVSNKCFSAEVGHGDHQRTAAGRRSERSSSSLVHPGSLPATDSRDSTTNDGPNGRLGQPEMAVGRLEEDRLLDRGLPATAEGSADEARMAAELASIKRELGLLSDAVKRLDLGGDRRTEGRDQASVGSAVEPKTGRQSEADAALGELIRRHAAVVSELAERTSRLQEQNRVLVETLLAQSALTSELVRRLANLSEQQTRQTELLVAAIGSQMAPRNDGRNNRSSGSGDGHGREETDADRLHDIGRLGQDSSHQNKVESSDIGLGGLDATVPSSSDQGTRSKMNEYKMANKKSKESQKATETPEDVKKKKKKKKKTKEEHEKANRKQKNARFTEAKQAIDEKSQRNKLKKVKPKVNEETPSIKRTKNTKNVNKEEEEENIEHAKGQSASAHEDKKEFETKQIGEELRNKERKTEHLLEDTSMTAEVKEETKADASSSTKEDEATPRYYDSAYKGPKDCYDHYKFGRRRDMPMKIKPVALHTAIEVFCDMTNGGWTLIQRRFDGSVDFFRDWDEYKHGFGTSTGEFWLGNDNIHYLTNQDDYSLRIELTDWDRRTAYAEYERFRIDDEAAGYRIRVSGYRGDAGDSLAKHDGHRFSTRDVDNDTVNEEFGGSCARRFTGAWWYYRCFQSNLNGRYYKGGQILDGRFDGVLWKSWTGSAVSLKRVEMKIRRRL